MITLTYAQYIGLLFFVSGLSSITTHVLMFLEKKIQEKREKKNG
jgi:hypothetical protein